MPVGGGEGEVAVHRLRFIDAFSDISENASVFIHFGLHPHVDSVFGHRKRSFLKMLSRVDLSENAVFALSCGRVKTELF